MYAPQPLAIAAPVALRLIGILDGDLVASFAALERSLGHGGAVVLVDVHGLEVLRERDMIALVEAVRAGRAQGRDIRLDAKGLAWRRVAKKELTAQPPIDATMRSGVRRTVIVAHSGKMKNR